MKKNVAAGILRAWIAFGIFSVFVVSIYIGNWGGGSSDDAWLFFVLGVIVVIVGFFLLRWVLAPFTKNDDE